MSVFDLLDQAGLGNLVASQGGAGGAAAGAAQGEDQQANNNQQQQAGNKDNNQQDAAADEEDAAADDNALDCNAAAGNDNQQADNNNDQQDAAAGNGTANGNANDNNNNQQDAAAGNADAAAGNAAAAGGADFGQCTPTITFQGGEGNRPATEFTFQIADPLARGGQGEALNPNIITNALCNQLTNVCGANAAAIAVCEDAKAQVAAAGTRNKSTADLFNTAVGFAGAVTNPAGGPDDVPAAAAAGGKARKMRRGLRA